MDTEQYAHQTDGVPPPSFPDAEPQGDHGITTPRPVEGAVSTATTETSLALSTETVPEATRSSEKLANQFASFDAEKTKKVFSELDEDIRKKSDAAVSALERAVDRWEDLVPKIAEMQALLSQRGEKRRAVLTQAGLPTWTQWFDSFMKKRGQRLSLRSIQKKLAKLRERNAAGSGHTPTTKRRAIEAAGDRQHWEKRHDAEETELEAQINAANERQVEFRKRIASLESENYQLARKVQQLHAGGGKATPKLVSQTEVLMEIADLSMEAFEIVNGNLGDRLIASDEGKRLVKIARKVIAMMAKVRIR